MHLEITMKTERSHRKSLLEKKMADNKKVALHRFISQFKKSSNPGTRIPTTEND